MLKRYSVSKNYKYIIHGQSTTPNLSCSDVMMFNTNVGTIAIEQQSALFEKFGSNIKM